ncbi:peptide/nickel transport system ATP-binding protein [Shewanella chilikensis]|uniref:Peptide/nickel transport system ATP-binding protein n=1 Tax=Shewanella chilikensis TaxID=558541 RepID=A0ABX5PL56_9GAMM|nr:ATP-binding cassette domain-containing protein [Shewanella chilikensis]MCL1152965.1 ATP-binding cassette domain-containing protein [Shewanella chilikensis]PYE57199.1 peptide/nickel transport system ATP-binding protein [Shewanella chilikensis]GGZ40515.1 peptide ABC transporter [Shewanella chilikensis]
MSLSSLQTKPAQSGSALELESALLPSASLSPLLSLSGGLAYRGHKVIELPDIAINHAEILGIWGDSGCGKSTMAAILTGLMPLAAGKLECSQALRQFRGRPSPIQWVIQQPEQAFNPRLTLAQSLNESWQGRDYAHLLPMLGVAESELRRWLASRPGGLSGGELQRLNILRAVAPETRLLICDEITAQLDMVSQQRLWQQLLQIAGDKQLTLLVISHDKPLLGAVCDRVQPFKPV